MDSKEENREVVMAYLEVFRSQFGEYKRIPYEKVLIDTEHRDCGKASR